MKIGSQTQSVGLLFFSNVGYLVIFSFAGFWKIIVTGIQTLGYVNVLFFKIVARIPLVVKNPAITMQQIMNIGISSI